ncbi:MAG: hypothetical protein ISS31_09685 [Kiritimatiellae bacterium]|nr:hypothetical protein [Kiritimatiellia bacterium]
MNSGTSRKQLPDLSNEHAVVEVKTGLTAARGLRDALVSLAMLLADRDDLRGYLLLQNPGLSKPFLESELQDFKATLRSDLVTRLHLVVARELDIVEGATGIHPDDRELVESGLRLEKTSPTKLSPASKQDEVFLVMLHQWVTGQGPMTSKWIEETVGCNYRTVASAVDRLGPAVRRHSDRSVSLKYFPEQDWGRLLATMYRVRSTALYSDASGQPRSPESLLRRLQSLERHDVGIGGVLGAKRYYEDLDIVGTPRLDLCIHCPDGAIDTDFVRRLDPALERTRDTHRPAQLALHFVRRRDPFFDHDSEGGLWADPVECLIELYSARLDVQARSFQEFLASRGRDLSGDD